MARNKHPEQTIQLILDTASRLFFQQGYDRTTLQDIINATGLSKGAIYHHFSSKEAILVAVVDQIGEYNSTVLAQVRDRKGLTGAEKLREVFRTSLQLSFQGRVLNMLPYLIENPKFMALQMQSILYEASPDYILPILQEGLADGSIQTEYPEQLSEVLLILSCGSIPSSGPALQNRCGTGAASSITLPGSTALNCWTRSSLTP